MRLKRSTEGVRCQASNAAKLAGEVALIGETGDQADFSEWQFPVEKITARDADAQAARVFADAFALEAAKDAGEMNGMHAGCGAEIIERQACATFGVQFFHYAGEPRWGILFLLKRKPRREARDFGQQAFHAERVRLFNGKGFSIQLHRQPEQRASTRVLASPVELAGAFRKPRFPAGPQFNMEKAEAARRDFVLMRNARRPEHQRHGRELLPLAAITFTIKALQQQTEKWQFVRVHRQLARDRMAQIAEDRAGMLQTMADGTEELSALEAGFPAGTKLFFSHGDSGRGKMLPLF